MCQNSIYFKLRKDIIIKDFCSDLNSKQKDAILNTEGSMLIFAGAGSGKTTVLVKKIINILNFGKLSDNLNYLIDFKKSDIDLMTEYLKNPKKTISKDKVYNLLKLNVPLQSEILVITFTNKAADELKNRLNKVNLNSTMWIHTFHSACLRILKKFFHKINLNEKFTIYDDNEKSKIITDILKLNNSNLDTKIISNKISKAKDNLISPNDYLQHYGLSENNKIISKIYLEYENYLNKMNALDFDNIILSTINLFEQNPDVKLYFQNKFKYIFVDEYQDTNYAQYKFINCIVNSTKNNICVVGDDDQSIYKFRGANVKNILNFENKYKNSIIIRLEQNYRSTKTILEAANNIITKNTMRKSKSLWTNNKVGNIIKIYEARDQFDEANYIVNDIIKQKIDFSECAILYRNHNLSTNIEMSLKNNLIPYKIIKGLSLFQRSEIIDIMSYFHTVNNINDFLRVKRIINKPSRGISKTTISILEKILNENNHINFQYFLNNISKYTTFFNKKAIDSIINFSRLIKKIQKNIEQKNLIELFDHILSEIDYINKICKNDESSIKHINEFRIFLEEYTSKIKEYNLCNFLQEISLFTDNNNNEKKISLMTIHAAKGMEYKHIYICGFEDGIFPSVKSLFSLEEEEEERRLCYVAMTRAKEYLTITLAKKRLLHGKMQFNKPSKFLADIPKKLTNINILQNNYFNLTKPDININNSKLEFKNNDKIIHKTFGVGIIKNIIKTNNDYLLIINFKNFGEKKFMLSYTKKYIIKY